MIDFLNTNNLREFFMLTFVKPFEIKENNGGEREKRKDIKTQKHNSTPLHK